MIIMSTEFSIHLYYMLNDGGYNNYIGSISALRKRSSFTESRNASDINIHRLLYAKSLSLNFRKFVVFVTVYARYMHSIFNFFMC